MIKENFHIEEKNVRYDPQSKDEKRVSWNKRNKRILTRDWLNDC